MGVRGGDESVFMLLHDWHGSDWRTDEQRRKAPKAMIFTVSFFYKKLLRTTLTGSSSITYAVCVAWAMTDDVRCVPSLATTVIAPKYLAF